MRIKQLNWQDTLAIRHEVIWPSKPIEFCHIENDENAWHYGVYIEQKLVCVASVYPELKQEPLINSARLRKFAILNAFQQQGIGSFILNHFIASLKAQSIRFFWCDAREFAVEFYKRFGFQITSSRFYKGDIPYVKMQVEIK